MINNYFNIGYVKQFFQNKKYNVNTMLICYWLYNIH